MLSLPTIKPNIRHPNNKQMKPPVLSISNLSTGSHGPVAARLADGARRSERGGKEHVAAHAGRFAARVGGGSEVAGQGACRIQRQRIGTLGGRCAHSPNGVGIADRGRRRGLGPPALYWIVGAPDVCRPRTC